MSEALYVTSAQVIAARLALELSEEAGEAPDEALKAIANAQVVAPEQSGPSHKTSAAPAPATEKPDDLQRLLAPQSQRDNLPQDRAAEQREAGSVNPPTIYKRPPGGTPRIGTNAPPPPVAVRGGTMSEEEREKIIAQHERRQREGQRGQQDRDVEGRDRDTHDPGSEGHQR
jgi:hypothetical protein